MRKTLKGQEEIRYNEEDVDPAADGHGPADRRMFGAERHGKDGGNEKVANRVAVFETNKGTFEIELFEDKTPITTKNFIDLAEKGFYNGLIFHRVIDGFMIQGGDPEGTGMGGPGYTIEDEFRPDLQFTGEGILAMANTGMPHTGGSQFFITLAKTPWLNGHHTIFGKVIKGMDVVREIGHTECDFRSGRWKIWS